MSFFGIDLFLDRMDELIQNIFEDVDMKRKNAYYAINPDCMLIAKKDKDYHEILKNKRNKVYTDGSWIIKTQKFLGLPISKERIATTDLFPRMLELCDTREGKIKIFLLGGKEGTAKKVIKNMGEKYKNVDFVGEHHGYFKQKNNIDIISKINEATPHILFVGLGCPVQEKWVNENIDKINANVILTCGGLFDYYSGNVKRSPKWMQENGLEWLFRLIQEPSRLYKRYIFGNIEYLISLLYIKIRGKKYYKNRLS